MATIRDRNFERLQACHRLTVGFNIATRKIVNQPTIVDRVAAEEDTVFVVKQPDRPRGVTGKVKDFECPVADADHGTFGNDLGQRSRHDLVVLLVPVRARQARNRFSMLTEVTRERGFVGHGFEGSSFDLRANSTLELVKRAHMIDVHMCCEGDYGLPRLDVEEAAKGAKPRAKIDDEVGVCSLHVVKVRTEEWMDMGLRDEMNTRRDFPSLEPGCGTAHCVVL
jgi:hypothetical protein